MNLDFIRDNASPIMEASPVKYVKQAEVRGSLFDPEDLEASGIVSTGFTNFFVDHEEPLDTLACVKEERHWPLGKLRGGHEFLLLVEAKRRRR